MPVFTEIEKKGHECVLYGSDLPSKLKCIIAIHDVSLGPALGGTRLWPYKSDEEALVDVLRLSRGMTYKAACAGLNLGGGKAVIIASPEQKTEAMFRAFGRFVERLGGAYITAEDVNTSVEDMRWVRKETKYVTGLPREDGGSGDPSPVTAYGVFYGMRAALEEALGSADFRGRTVAIQGLGKVGYALCGHLADAGAVLYVADIEPKRVEKAVKEFKARKVDPEEIFSVEADVFSPNALGGIITSKVVERMRFKIIAGGANNQLEDDDVQGAMLKSKAVLYAPDYVLNAGGLINVHGELEEGGYNEEKAYQRAAGIYDRMKELFRIAAEEDIPTTEAAKVMARRRLSKKKETSHGSGS
ncbi:MAG: leucine dehydrogenase [Latescibacteria bacterium DG_63]|nr:MAG: leucine dehydrogenase [Latescibacteria bacterium DG_63]